MKYPLCDLKKANNRFAPQLREAATRVIDSGRYIGGAEVELLESDIRLLTSTATAIGVGNGLDALRLALRACILAGRLNEGDGVIVAANTYIASVLAISDAGLKPVLVDPDEETMCLNGEAVRRNLTPEVKVIMPVHLYGRVAWDNEMVQIARQHNLLVIEDVAQAIGAKSPADGLFDSHTAGGLGHIGALSFYPTKNVGALGDAGMVVTNLPDIARIVRALANYGSDHRYHNIYKGFNSRLDPMQAAMLRVKLAHEEELTAERFALAMAYRNTINNPAVKLPLMSSRVTDCVWHQYVIRCRERERLREFLSTRGVETDIHYPTAVHHQPCYSELSHLHLPISDKLAEEILSLPITPGCTSVREAAEIGRIINEFK